MKESPRVIETEDLVKNFGSETALDGLGLTVRKGEVHGFLGPNGSGKSTTIRILLGLLRKTSGRAKLMGKDPWKDSVKLHRRLAYVPGEVNLWPNLSGGEAIDLLGSLRGGLDEKRRKQLLDEFQLDPRKKFRTYSKGNRQKVALVAAFASDVELYILDEPTSGLDPLMESVFQKWVKQLKKDGKTVLLSSHILAEIEALCDVVTIIRNGRTVQSGTLNDLRYLQHTTIKVEATKKLTGFNELQGIHHLRTSGKHASFQVESKHLDAALNALSKQNIVSLTSNPPTLEELFLRHYNSNNNEER